MKKRYLGMTNIQVSPLGLGTVKFGRNTDVKYPDTFELPDDQALSNLLACAQELGINLLDTAPAYGDSEKRLGKLLAGQRDRWVICSKVGEEYQQGESSYCFTDDYIQKRVEQSLRYLNTDYLDILLIHSNGDDVNIIERFAVFETLALLKKQGMIRAYGMSTKTVAGGLLALDYADVVMMTYNPLTTIERPVLTKAYQHNKGILIKKVLASGHLNKIVGDNPVQKIMDFIFKESGVSSVIIGTLSQQHLRDNARCVAQALG